MMAATRSRTLLVHVGAAVMIAGCASYQLPPLAANHPAHPDAPAAPARSPSRTLAYTRADIPVLRPVAPVPAVQHGEDGPRSAEGQGSATVVGEGEVVATVPNASQIVLEHGEIKGFMDAMTMGYRIDPPSLLARVKPGDRVRFTIDVARRAIIDLEPLR